MCGRVSTSDQEFIARKLQLKYADELIKPGSINLPPTLELPVITDEKPKKLQYFYWSLIPFWAKEKPKFSSFNARPPVCRVKRRISTDYSINKSLQTRSLFTYGKTNTSDRKMYPAILMDT